MDKGHNIFCPIAHTHPLTVHSDLLNDKDGSWWLDQDFGILRHCSQLWVYMMPGWKDSVGIGREIEFAQDYGLVVVYVERIKND